ncbi:hypothetical protein DFH09DRAFT_1088060 [Mycena vulgaris]|nr:hypothetical protein DFH09DRAFT_1088060 [Mycena vulgaris]
MRTRPQPLTPNAPPVDPNARKSPPADPVPPVDPNALKTLPPNPNTPPVDPNAHKTPAPDPNAPPINPNARKSPPADPVPPVNPNAHRAPPADPNAPPVNPNVRKSLPADPNTPPVAHLEEKESNDEEESDDGEDSGKEEDSGQESEEESDEGAGKPSVRRPEEGLRNLATHQERHPDDPTQPEKSKKRKTKKGSAEKSTAGLKQKELKQARAGLAEAVAALHLLVEEKAEELAAEYHLSLDEVKDVVRSATKFKKRRGYHEFNAKVWQRGDKGPGEGLDVHQLRDIVLAEPEGTWSPEQLAQLKADYTTHQLGKKEGTRATNAEAAKDATFIGDRFFEELILLEKRTGARGFAVIAGSNVNDTIIPTVVGSPESCKFLADVHKMTPATYALKFNKWACFREEVDTDKMGHTELKGVVAKALQENLRHVSGNDAMKIDYKNYEEIMLAFHGYEIVGWPDNVPIAAPSNLGRGGSAALKLLLKRLKSNTCFWRAVDSDRRKELQTKWEKQGGKKGKGKKKATKKQEEEEEEEEKEEPQTMKSKGKKRQREAEEEEEEEAPAKRKRKTTSEKRKRSKTVASSEEEAEAEETEQEPEPAKKASKKAKGGAKAVETVEGEPSREKKTAVETVEEEPPRKKKKTAVETVEEEPPKKKKKDAVESVGGTAPKKTQKKKAVEVEEEDDAPASKSKGKRKQREDDEENTPRKKAAFSKRRKAPAPGRSASVVPSDTGSEPEGPDTPDTPDDNTGNNPDGAARLMAIKAKKAAAQKEADEAKARMSAANPRKTSKNAVAGSSKPLKLAAINDDDEYESSDSDDTD